MIVIAAASFDTDRLGNAELDMIDMLLVPQWLEHAVGKAKGQNILHRLFAEIMIDTIYLAFIPIAENFAVQLLRRG